MEIDLAGEPATSSRMADLYAAHMPAAIRLALVLTGSREDAEDLAQEAFIRTAGRFADLRSRDAFPAYLRRAVVNASKMRIVAARSPSATNLFCGRAISRRHRRWVSRSATGLRAPCLRCPRGSGPLWRSASTAICRKPKRRTFLGVVAEL